MLEEHDKQKLLNKVKDCWLSVLLHLLLPLASPQQRLVLVSSLKESSPPASQSFESLSHLVQAIQSQSQAGASTKKLVSEAEVRFPRQERGEACDLQDGGLLKELTRVIQRGRDKK